MFRRGRSGWLPSSRVSQRSRGMALWGRTSSEIALPLFKFHRAFLVVIDYPILSLRAPEGEHFLDDFRHRVSVGENAAGARNTAKRTHSTLNHLRLLSRKQANAVL